MAAPLSTLLTALRNPLVGVARHLFFTLAHSQGTVYAWDGIGDISIGGDTYVGVGNLVSVEGVSQTRELQTHQVAVTLQGVPLTAIRDTDQDVRNDTAVIKIAWLLSDGTVLGPRTIFSGLAENLQIKPTRDTVTLRVNCRGPIANWARPPGAYYTPGDQDRLFSGDAGLNYVPGLENATTSGWSINAETSGGVPVWNNSIQDVVNDVTGNLLGHHTYGLVCFRRVASGWPIQAMYYNNLSINTNFEEDGTGSTVSGQFVTLQVGGVNCYIDDSGDARSAGGVILVAGSTGTSYRMREQGAIASVGTGSANYVGQFTPTGTGFLKYGSTSLARPVRYGQVPSGQDFTSIVYDNRLGMRIYSDGTDIRDIGTDDAYVEAVTGTAVQFVSGYLEVSGSKCSVSSTGAIITPAGNYVVLSTGTSDNFLRVWT